MKDKKIIILISALVVCLLFAAISWGIALKVNEVPEGDIVYSKYEIGHIIQDEKQAISFNFAANYNVTKIQIAGELLDAQGNVIHTFDTEIKFSTATNNPSPSIIIDSEIAESVASVNFTTIRAFTKDRVK